jgi:hypothetical protein
MRTKPLIVSPHSADVSQRHATGRRPRRDSHPEFPLERVCAHLSEPFQLAFARQAQQHFLTREDVEVIATHLGLTIRAETEDAIDAAVVLLKDLFGPQIRIGPPQVRFHEGVTLEQPWMGVHVRCTTDHLHAVSADLADREATIVSCDVDRENSHIQANAPLAALLGYRQSLASLTSSTATHAMWLSHFAPVEDPPPGGNAA